MAASSRRSVITGVGVLSPIGQDAGAFWRSLQEGRSGVHSITTFDASALPVRFAGEIPDFDAKEFRRKERSSRPEDDGPHDSAGRRPPPSGRWTTAPSIRAKLVPERFGVEFGAGLIATELPELADACRVSVNCQPGRVDLEKWGEQGLSAIQPLWMLKYLPNMLACHVSILHDARGPNNSVTEGDAASLLALGEAYRILGRDQADFFLVGGAESKINPLSLVRQCLYEPLSRRNDAPEKACRPFDRGRDGLVVGEGAGVFVLEELEHAQQARRSHLRRGGRLRRRLQPEP